MEAWSFTLISIMKRIFNLIILLLAVQYAFSQGAWISDNGDGTYKNPILYADYSDPDICRVGEDFYMTSSSFNAIPGLPILHSKDLVNWEIINHALQPNVDPFFDIPQHGNGVWAPSIRYNNGVFYIYWGDPDRGIFMVKTEDPNGEWSAPVLVKKAYGNIDACPLWDSDGKVYLVHAFAHSRAGINCTLQVVELTPEGDQILDKGKIVIDGHENHPTLEGPKFYKRNGYYYIFAPAGGVPTGWQAVFRSKNIYGPYEDKIVLAQGQTVINGPHQGGLVELDNGESWFVHFQDKDAYGRIVHLQPVSWVDDWPIMGTQNSEGISEPVLVYSKPNLKIQAISVPQTSDNFEDDKLGPQWQWSANPRPHWFSLSEKPGSLVLRAIPVPVGRTNLWMVPNILTQKLPAPSFMFTSKVDISNLRKDEETGVLVFGLDYAGISLEKSDNDIVVKQIQCIQADRGLFPETNEKVSLEDSNEFWLKITVSNGYSTFQYSTNGKQYLSLGSKFKLREGKWVGAKLGLYSTRQQTTGISGSAEYDWVRIEKN
ncbi:MAG: beta-xylosidase [Cyclobacteriaceae bacterium]|jgi:beta-xylosidase